MNAPGGLDTDSLEVAVPIGIVAGWFLADRGYSRVEVQVGDREPVRARPFASATPEQAWVTQEPSAPLAGWAAQVDLHGVEPGSPLEVKATAVGSAGRTELGSARMVAVPRPRLHPPEPDWIETLKARASEAAAHHRPGTGLRLLVFAHNMAIAGAELYLAELIEHLLEGRPDARCLVVTREDGPIRARLERCGATVHEAPWPKYGDDYESHMRRLALLASEFEANVVFANTILSFNGVDLAERLGIPAIWAIHESLSFDELLCTSMGVPDDHVESRLRGALDSAELVVFETKAAHRLYSDAAEDPGRLTCIDFGIELDELEAFRRQADRDRLRADRGYRPEDRVLLCPAMIHPRKAQALLTLAFARVSPDFPDVVLELVGDISYDEFYVWGLKQTIERLGLGHRIRLEPATERIEELFTAADALVLPSDNEGVPRVILMAMALRMPVLATNVFGIPELIDDGVNGLLCEPQDLDSMESGLRRLLSLTPEEAATLGAAGEATVRPSRDAGRYAARIGEILDALAAKKAPSGDQLG